MITIPRIYSDIEAEILTSEGQMKMVYIYDKDHGRYSPSLILPDLLAVWKLRNYLDKVVRENKDYMRRAGLSMDPPKE